MYLNTLIFTVRKAFFSKMPNFENLNLSIDPIFKNSSNYSLCGLMVDLSSKSVINKLKNPKNYPSMDKYKRTGFDGKLLFWFANFCSASSFSLLCFNSRLIFVHRSIVFKIYLFFLFTYFY